MSSMRPQPSGPESSTPFIESDELRHAQEWSKMLAHLHREAFRMSWKKEYKLPLHLISPTVVFISELESLLFPEHKLKPNQIPQFEEMIKMHEEAVDKLFKKHSDLSQYVFLLKTKLTKLKKHIIGLLL